MSGLGSVGSWPQQSQEICVQRAPWLGVTLYCHKGILHFLLEGPPVMRLDPWGAGPPERSGQPALDP